MAKVTQKVDLDATKYRDNLKKLASDTQKETNKVNDALNDSGNAVRDFNDRVQSNTDKSGKAFQDLFKGIKGGLGVLSLAGLGVGLGSQIAKTVKESLDFTDIMNKISVRTGQSAFEQAEFKNQLFGISARTNVDEEQITAAAENALALGVSTKEAAKFSEVIAKASKSFKDVDPASFSKEIIDDLKARGQKLTAESAKASIKALFVGIKTGFGTVTEGLAAAREISPEAQKRAKLSLRDVINLFAGARGVGADPALINESIRALISATDTLKSTNAVQGILGTQFRDAQGGFDITAKNLDEIAAKLKPIKTEQQQRALIESIPGIGPEAAEGILQIVEKRVGFIGKIEKAKKLDPNVEAAFKKATSGFLEQLSKLLNKATIAIKKDISILAPPVARIPLGVLNLNPNFGDRTSLRLPGEAKEKTPTQMQRERKPAIVEQQREITINSKIEITSVPPGFGAFPSSSDLSRTPGGN